MSKLAVALLFSFALAGAVQARELKVVASIQPLHSLTAAVMEGAGSPERVISGQASEHSYALKPSEARLVQAADLVVLVSTAYESFLARPLSSARAARLEMAALPGLKVLEKREGGAWDEAHHHDGKGDADFHQWLDIGNARLLVTALAERLSVLAPEKADTYRANAERTKARLDALDDELKARLAPLRQRPYVVFHDAYQYLEARYGLSPAGSITIDPDRPPSARRMAGLRDRLKSAKAACVFREPQFPSPLAASLAEAAGARQGLLDPQGALIPPGPDQYFIMMRQLADSLSSCLSGG